MKTKRRIRAINLFQDLLKQIKTAQDIAKQVDQLFNNLQEDLDEDLRLTEPLDHDELEKSLRKSLKDQSDVNISGSNTDKLNSKRISRIAGSRRVAVSGSEVWDTQADQSLKTVQTIFKEKQKGRLQEDFKDGSFGESIEQIEKLGHKRVIQNALKSWSEELSAKPKKKFNQTALMEREKEVKVQKRWKSDTENADKEVLENRSKLELH
ncbi:hypothetical protein PPACK8108_LOCUS26101 [Phakopsora pachyrhizi]|uniref:Uncharacterized protein n=1 Tax=Phakopsora pachyrhizi TaxID=170000 RepID=A0AAV0BV74_PHAPC|nr:hypothetical protein PPACK8108_LOCUS26101 [Phakopsora pachyrhizi]